MPDERVCPRCGMKTATSLACEYCGYRFQIEEGEVEFKTLGGSNRMPLRLNLRAMLAASGVLVLSMCICPQTWLVGGTLVDRALGIQGGFWSASNAAAAAMIACPAIYGVVLLIAGFLAWRRSRQTNSPQ